MPQEIAIVPNASVMDNITLGAEATRWGLRSVTQCRAQAQAAVAAVGLDVDVNVLVATLSPAHQRMVMMARAVHRDARLLILDEPTAGLPEHEAALVVAAVRRLIDRQLTVLYVSHHLSEVAALCDRVICVRESLVIADLAAEQITKETLVGLLVGVDAEHETRSGTKLPENAAEEDISVRLGAVSGHRVHEVTVEARPGEVLGLTGLLGSGVDEIVSFLTGAADPSAGIYELDGATVHFKSPADALDRGVGYLPGERGQAAFPALAIRENVSLPALKRWFGRLGVIHRHRERQMVSGCLRTLSVSADPELPLRALSGGNQQRALVARLVAADISVLVLSEPTVGVDVRARAELWDAVRDLARTRTVIVASSDPEELAALAHRVICIRRGHVSAVLEDDAVTERAITLAIA
jgi:ABC-type sugar transport system ATPase subunit